MVTKLNIWYTYWRNYFTQLGRDSSVGVATRYELDVLGIEYEWGEIFLTRPDRPWGPPSILYKRYRVSLPGVRRPGRGVDHPLTSSAEVKERVELYLYSTSGPSWPVQGELYLLYLLLYLTHRHSAHNFLLLLPVHGLMMVLCCSRNM